MLVEGEAMESTPGMLMSGMRTGQITGMRTHSGILIAVDCEGACAYRHVCDEMLLKERKVVHGVLAEIAVKITRTH